MPLINQIYLVSLISHGLLEFSLCSVEIHLEITKSLMGADGVACTLPGPGGLRKLVRGLLSATSTPCANPSFCRHRVQPQSLWREDYLDPNLGKMRAESETYSPGGQ